MKKLKMVLDKTVLPKAYKEVVKIIEYLPDEEYIKIPEEIIQNLKEEMDDSYIYEIDDLESLEVLKETEEILAVIFRDYLSTSQEKRAIVLREKQEAIELEEEKRRKYSPNNIFAKQEKNFESINIILPVEIKKQNIFSKIISFIKEKIFRK